MAATEGTGLVLSVSLFGERQRLLTVFSETQGRMRGLQRGLKSKPCQPLDRVQFEHFRRLDTQLGTLDIDVLQSRAGWWLNGGVNLLAVNWLVELLQTLLPEEHPYPRVNAAVERFLDEGLNSSGLWKMVVEMELFLLRTVGYGLDLTADVVRENDSDNSEIMYVSPKSGRAISAQMGRPFADKLFVLPGTLGGPVQDAFADCRDCLNLTGFFLNQALHNKVLPARRQLSNALLEQLYRTNTQQ